MSTALWKEVVAMRELAGKGWRVLGYFVWMLGAGVVLDSEACRVGVLVMTTGAAMFGLGVVQSVVRAEEVES